MIALASDCLLFQMSSGESVPFSADMISVELLGPAANILDSEYLHHATNAVFHYFKHELDRQTVSVNEFSRALEKALRGFGLTGRALGGVNQASQQQESDLCGLAHECGADCELFFFARLREELRRRLRQGPRIVRFRGLRGCVKKLTGARRWSLRCRNLEEQIVTYLRECLSAEGSRKEFALIVE